MRQVKPDGTVIDTNAPASSLTPASSVVSETSFGQASAVGTSLAYARQDHTHGTPTLGAPTWTAPTLLNSWVNYDAALFNPAGYYKDAYNRVHLRGLVKSGTVGGVTPIFTLPAGFRPAREEALAVTSNTAFGEVRVATGGNVYVLSGNNTYVSLDGLSFTAA